MRGSDRTTPVSTVFVYAAPGVLGGILGGLLMGFGLTGCGGAPKSDAAAVQSAIHSLAAGDLIRQMNAASAKSGAGTASLGGSSNSGDPKKEPQSEMEALALPPRQPGKGLQAPRSADPCPKVPHSSEDAAANQAAMADFGTCLRSMMGPYEAAENAFTYLRIFERGLTETPFSQMTDEEIATFMATGLQSPGDLVGQTVQELPIKLKIRNRFEDRDLDELVRLAIRRAQALRGIELAMFSAYDFHKELVDRYSSVNSRWMLFKALRETVGDTEGEKAGQLTAEKIASVLVNARMAVPSNLKQFPVKLLHPYALVAFVPDEDNELAPLNPKSENPFGQVKKYLGLFGGDLELVTQTRKLYTDLRSIENPELPSHAAAAAGAARVAFIDSGIDFLQYPDLGLFLAPAGVSQDLADADGNPFMPALEEYAHGSGTTATLLTILSHYAPEVLAERKIEVAMWKTSTIREFLGGPSMDAVNWDSRLGLQDGLITSLREASGDVPSQKLAPQILSVSMAFPVQEYIDKLKLKTPGLVSKSPWLWVMAAGNAGVEVGKDRLPTCLSDVPDAERPDARILCVGALVKGIVNDQVASYSNFGPRVDVYAYDSYYSLCPNGTSCATPAVSSAAAAILAKFPTLTPEQLKSVIVEASVRRTLPVQLEEMGGGDSSDGVQSVRTREVLVFDAPTMLGRALEIAAVKAASPSQRTADARTVSRY